MTAPLVDRLQAAVDHPSHFSDSEHAELHAEAIEMLRVSQESLQLVYGVAKDYRASLISGRRVWLGTTAANTEPNR